MKTIRKSLKILMLGMMLVMIFAAMSTSVYATDDAVMPEDAVTGEETSDDSTGMKAMSAALVVGLAASTGAIAMGFAIARSVEGISRQPEAEGKIRTSLMLGLVFVETAIIYALIIAVLIIFVL